MCGQLTPLTRDFHRLLKNVKKLTDNQVQIIDYDDDISEFTIEIKPSDGFYKRGKFEFRIELQNNYPTQPPDVRTLTEIYHPNINTIKDSGYLCLSLFDEWEPSNDLEDCVQGLLYLIYNPNLEDPLNSHFSSTDVEQMERFADDVKISLQGGNVDGFVYERNIVDDNTDEIVEGNTNNAENDSEVELAEEVRATEASTALQTTTPTTTQITAIETTVETTTELTTRVPTTATTISSTMLATTPTTSTATATTTTTPHETTRMILTTTETTTTTISSTPIITTMERTNKYLHDANPEKNERELTNCNYNANDTGLTINNLNEKPENNNKEMEKKNFDKNATHVHTDITKFNGNIHVQFKPRGTFPQYYYWNA